MTIEIENYHPRFVGEFERIWVYWLRNAIGIEPEPEDLEEVRDLNRSYIQQGGTVFFTTHEQQCIGIVALKNLGNLDYEFCKLVVDEDYRGMGIGKKLIEKCITFVRESEGERLYLQTSYRLGSVLDMYEKMGFNKCTPPEGMHVKKRSDIVMMMQM